MPIVPSNPIEISGSLVPFGKVSGVIVKVDVEGPLGFAGNLTANDNVTIAVATKIAASDRRANVIDRKE